MRACSVSVDVDDIACYAAIHGLGQAGFRYDSPVFPCPLYYAAKAATLIGLKRLGRAWHAVLDSPNVLRAPQWPYRAGEPYWAPGSRLLELPIQVGPLRLPFIGTSFWLVGPFGASLFTRGLVGLTFVNLELHGIEFRDARDVPEPMRAVQPELRIPLPRKLKTLSVVLTTLRRHCYSLLRLDEAARTFAASFGSK